MEWTTEGPSWASSLGLVDLPLYPSADQAGSWALLNGQRGSFALSTPLAPPPDLGTGASWAWSADFPHHISLDEDTVSVTRWDMPSSVRKFRRTSVEQKLESFYEYLVLDAVESRYDVVEHAIDVFRRLRALNMQLGVQDQASIHQYLYLIASWLSGREGEAFDDVEGLAREYNLDLAQAHAFQALGPEHFESILTHFRTSLQSGRQKLSVDPELMVRHAGGTIFQEAHYELIRSGQVDLFGIPDLPDVRITSRGGTHFTPPALARTVTEKAIRETIFGDHIIILDPACGAGAFLQEAVRLLHREKYRGKVTLMGFDVSEAAVAMAKFALAACRREQLGFELELDIRHLDSLDPENNWPAADVILMNPPFISWIGLTPVQRQRVRDTLGDEYHGRPDYSMAFVQKAVRSVRTGGSIGTLIPASLLSLEASLAWRKRLLNEVSPRFVALLGDHTIFRHAVVEVAALVLSRTPQTVEQPILSVWTSEERGSGGEALRHLRMLEKNDSLNRLGTLAAVEERWRVFAEPSEAMNERVDWRPRPNRLERVLSELQRLSMPTVGALFHVRQGIRTGLRDAFIVPPELYRTLPAEEQRYFRPIAENKNIRNGRILPGDYLFYPESSELEPIRDESDLKQRLPQFFQLRLRNFRGDLQRRQGVDVEQWWRLTRPRQWLSERAPKLVSAYFGYSGSFALDTNGTYVIVQGFAWLPKASLSASMLPDRLPSGARAKFQEQVQHAYLALLNSRVFTMLLAEYCPHVSGGQFNLSSRFVESIPLPNLGLIAAERSMAGEAVTHMAELGRKMSLGEYEESFELDRLVMAVYSVPADLWPDLI